MGASFNIEARYGVSASDQLRHPEGSLISILLTKFQEPTLIMRRCNAASWSCILTNEEKPIHVDNISLHVTETRVRSCPTIICGLTNRRVLIEQNPY